MDRILTTSRNFSLTEKAFYCFSYSSCHAAIHFSFVSHSASLTTSKQPFFTSQAEIQQLYLNGDDTEKQSASQPGQRAFLSPSSGDLGVLKNPQRSHVILLLNLKITRIGVTRFSHDVRDILYLSASHLCHVSSSHNLSTLGYTCLSICLRVCMSACLLGMCE